jgi:hypothetical protein
VKTAGARRESEDVFERLSKALNRLFEGARGPSLKGGGHAFSLIVRCGKCGELIRVRIDKDNELQAEYGDDAAEGDHPTGYVLRKEIVGANCQNLIHFTLRFDANQRLCELSIEGGEFVEPEPAS